MAGSDNVYGSAGRAPVPHPEGAGEGSWVAPIRIRRILTTTAWFGGLVAFLLWAYAGGPWALGYLGGLFAGGLNLFLIASIVRHFVAPGRWSAPGALGAFAAKMLVVYGSLGVMLSIRGVPKEAVALGFSTHLFVIAMKALGRLLIERSRQQGGLQTHLARSRRR